jgi:hypothetical protein
MEENSLHQVVFSKNAIEFVTVASEFCITMEKVSQHKLSETLSKMQKLLPLLYLKASLLPASEKVLEEELEKHVSELDYNVLHQKWLDCLTEYDTFFEVFDPAIQVGHEAVTASISENLLDIYQDLKDFLMSYSIGNEEIMNDALAECTQHFTEFWGQRLVNVLRAIHMLLYSGEDLDINIRNQVKPAAGNPKWLDNYWGTEE